MNDWIKTLTGTLFLLVYCLSTAVSSILIDDTEHGLSMGLTLFYAFSISLLFCHALNLFKFKRYWSVLWQQRQVILEINITTTIVWLGMFYALLIISPAIVTSLYLGAIPVATFVLQYRQLKTIKEKVSNAIFVILIAFILLALMLDDLKQITDWSSTLVGMIICVVCAVTGAIGNIKARELGVQKIPASMVLATSLYLTVFVSIILLFLDQESFVITRHELWEVLIVAGSSLVVPLFLLQKGLERVDPLYVSLLLPFIPVMTFVLQLFSPLYHFAWLEFILIVSLALVISVSTVVKMKLVK